MVIADGVENGVIKAWEILHLVIISNEKRQDNGKDKNEKQANPQETWIQARRDDRQPIKRRTRALGNGIAGDGAKYFENGAGERGDVVFE